MDSVRWLINSVRSIVISFIINSYHYTVPPSSTNLVQKRKIQLLIGDISTEQVTFIQYTWFILPQVPPKHSNIVQWDAGTVIPITICVLSLLI